MMGRVLSVAAGLLGVCFAVGAQPTNWRGAIQNDHGTALSLSQPKFFSAKDSSILLHKGPVYAWSDGGRLASNAALAEIGMAPLDVFPVAYLPPNTSGVATAKRASAASNSPPKIPHRSKHNVGIVRIEFDVRATGRKIPSLENLLPRLPAIGSLVQTAIRRIAPQRAGHRRENRVAISRINDDSRDALGFL